MTSRARTLTAPSPAVNKRKFIMLALAMLAACLAAFAARPAHAEEVAVAHMNVQQAKQLIAALPDLQIIDVRTGGEFREGHLNGAVNINYYSPLFRRDIGKFDRDRPYLVHCKTGARSSRAVRIMRELGFTMIYHMDGGTDAWRAASLPFVRD
ncbi:MAG: rhodanese-like domain-containing protein [Parvularculaceae bacterium]